MYNQALTEKVEYMLTNWIKGYTLFQEVSVAQHTGVPHLEPNLARINNALLPLVEDEKVMISPCQKNRQY